MSSDITFVVREADGSETSLTAPTDMGLSLMEFLKASDYPILATCEGMALCATCHVEVLHGQEQLPAPGDAELDMLDTLPQLRPGSRLSCQLRLANELDGVVLRIVG